MERYQIANAMQPLQFYLRTCLDENLLIPFLDADVYITPSIAEKMRRNGSTQATLRMDEYFVGTYESLKRTKKKVGSSWAGTEIHHIVENYHLQFLGLIDPINQQTYDRSEPCVLLTKAHHSLVIENAVGVAETLFLESKPFNFITAFQQENPGVSKKSKTRQSQLRVAWVKRQERYIPPRITRQEIKQTLLKIYRFAYQERDLKPLRLIAESVIQSMPL